MTDSKDKKKIYFERKIKRFKETGNHEDAEKLIERLGEDFYHLSVSNSSANIPNNFESKNKLVFFSKGDDKFIWDIINELSRIYEVKKITITTKEEFNLIDEWMEWADVCWFEWCDELIIYASNLKIAVNKKIICRLHSYEAFLSYINKVKWNRVDKVIFVANHTKEYVLEQEKSLTERQTVVIPNGINLNKYIFKHRDQGFNIAYVGFINHKKGPMLLLHAFKAVYDYDSRYKLYIAGEFQDPRYVMYYKQMVQEFGLQENVFFEGWQKNIETWLEDKHYIISSSVLESQHLSIMEAMAKGLKPLIHSFVGATDIYEKNIYGTV